MEAGQHHPVPGIVLLQQAQHLLHGLHAGLSALLYLHIDAVLREGRQQLLQRRHQEDLLVPRRHPIRVLHISRSLLPPVPIGKASPLPAQLHLLGGVGVAKVHLLRHQVAVIPVDDPPGHIGLAVQRRIVRKDDHPVPGNGNIGLHHCIFIHAVCIIESLQCIIRELLIPAAVGDQQRQRALLHHRVRQGIVLPPG